MTQPQQIISFDIGIKNMALCMFSMDSSSNEIKNNPFEITAWSVLNLMDEPTEITEKCTQNISIKSSKKTPKNPKKQKKIVTVDNVFLLDNRENPENQMNLCGKMAKYKKSLQNSESIFFCEKCAKKQTEFLLPKKIYQSTSLKKLNIEDLEKIMAEFSIEWRYSTKTGESKKTKKSFIDILTPFFQNKCLETVVEPKKVGAGDTDLITIGRNMMRILDQIPNIYAVDMVLIENQISTIATRMKSVQGMLAQYFIMRCPGAKIEFISSSNKLRGLVLENKEIRENIVNSEKTETQQKQHYKKHKTDGVQITKEILGKNPFLESKIQVLSESKKKDDLADAFLQGIWYLRKNERIIMDEFRVSLPK